MIYITDYIKNPSIEKKYSKNSVYSFLDNQIPHKKIKVLLVWHEKIDKAYLEKFPNLKAVVRYGVGFDTVNLMACKDKDKHSISNEAADLIYHLQVALLHNGVEWREVLSVLESRRKK